MGMVGIIVKHVGPWLTDLRHSKFLIPALSNLLLSPTTKADRYVSSAVHHFSRWFNTSSSASI